MDLDIKYEFNAPKYVDFTQMNDTYDTSDNWFDGREGDEGGISTDMEPFYENAIGYTNATTAISAALDSNRTVEVQVHVDIPHPDNKSQMKITCSKTPDNKSQTYVPDDNLLVITQGDNSQVHYSKTPDDQTHNNIPDIKTLDDKSQVHDNKTDDQTQMSATGIKAPDDNTQINVCDSNSQDDVSQMDVLDSKIPDDQTQINATGIKAPDDNTQINVCNRNSEDDVSQMDVLDSKIPGDKVHECALQTDTDEEKGTEVTDGDEDMEDTDAQSTSYTTEEQSDHERGTYICKSVQFLTPEIGKKQRDQPTRCLQSCSQLTPKSRFQPVRKSTAKVIDYADRPKRKHTPSKDESNAKKARIMQPRSSAKRALEKMRQLQQQTKEHRRHNERNMKKALKGKNFAPVRCTNLTVTKEFGFILCNKVKEHSMSTRSEKPFEENLRQESMIGQNFKNKPTKPVPFNFTLPDKMKVPTQNWESMAEAANNFHHKTPTRYRQKLSDQELRNKPTFKPQQVTKPVTPQLLTRTRVRNVAIESAQDIEEKIVEEMKSYQFKATELNPKIMEMKGMYGVKHVAPSSNTEQQPFNFKIDQRVNQRKNDDLSQEAEVNGCDKTKKNDKLKATKLQPFSFEERDKDRNTKKEEKIKHQLAEEKKLHEFHANLLPSFSPDILPDVTTKEPTKQMPFNMSEGSQSYQYKHEQKLRKEADDERSKRKFKAQDCLVTVKEPFQPMKGLIPPTNVANIVLNTETRAVERSKFEEWKNEKEKKEEEGRIKLEKERQLEEEEEIKKLRRDAVHKANPVRTFKPVEIKKSTVPLTEAKTPNLEVRKRAVLRGIKKLNK